MYQKDFRNLLIFYFAFIFFISFTRSILPSYYHQVGLSLREIIFGNFLFTLAPFVTTLILTKFSAKKSWYLANITFMLFILLVVKIVSPLQFYVAMMLSGLYFYLFFIFYNIAHFENTPQLRRGESSAVMFSIGPIINVAAPILAGAFAEFNMWLFWLAAGLLFVISISLVRNQKDFQISYSPKAAIAEIKATRLFIFIEGVWEAMIFGIIPVYTLFFIQTPLNYGVFISYLGLVGVASNLILGRFTDKVQKRSVFLYPITIALATITFVFPLAVNNIYFWAILSGAITFFVPIFWNVSTAMFVDTHKNLRLAIPGRELALVSGRAIGLVFTFISFSVEKQPKYIFLFLGLVMMCYPLALYWRTKIKKSYQYL